MFPSCEFVAISTGNESEIKVYLDSPGHETC